MTWCRSRQLTSVLITLLDLFSVVISFPVFSLSNNHHVEKTHFLQSTKASTQTKRLSFVSFRTKMNQNIQSTSEGSSFPSDPTRRDFLSWGSTTAASSILLGMSGEAYAADIEATSAAKPPNWRKSSGSLPYMYNPQKPFSSVRRYKTITLKNGLRVMLVSDKSAPFASAAMSVGGAGQFSNPNALPGLAHLMEHMVLSFETRIGFRPGRDFEDWLNDEGDGSSNGFTAYDTCCYHFFCKESVFSQALERFAELFQRENVKATCRDDFILRREIRRVDSELNYDDESTQALYLVKDFVNPDHPYSRFSAGNMDTLERFPKAAGIDVGDRLIDFFDKHYQPDQAVLVVVSPQDLSSLKGWVAPFSKAFSRSTQNIQNDETFRHYPGAGFLQGNRPKQMILYKKSSEMDMETLSMEWSLDIDYRELSQPGKFSITARQIGFVIAQVLGRRGPGSLYFFLLRRGWIPSGLAGVPHILLPVEVSGFQVIKLEVRLTLEGFINRSAVVAAIYDTIDTAQSGERSALSRQLVAQYGSIAKLHGYINSSRPPDAVELAIDAQSYGLDGPQGVASGNWYLFPSEGNPISIAYLKLEVEKVLSFMSDPSNAIIVVTAGNKAIEKSQQSSIFGESLPLLSSSRWLSEPVTGARFCYTDMLQLKSRVEELVLTRLVDEDEILRPFLNPLIPVPLRPARTVIEPLDSFETNTNIKKNLIHQTVTRETEDSSASKLLRFRSNTISNPTWTILDPIPGRMAPSLPRRPPEPSCSCAFVIQLLSSRPARANVKQAALAELWKLSFEQAVVDLAELGIPAGLAYELSFNKFGLRILFAGVSQNLPSYARRISRRLVEHHVKMKEGKNGKKKLPSSLTSSAIKTAKRATNLSKKRFAYVERNINAATLGEVASEGEAFLRSCSGAVCFAEGDLLRKEVKDLVDNLEGIFESSTASSSLEQPARPSIDDLLYWAEWKPRPPSPCSIAGARLISDVCGRVPR